MLADALALLDNPFLLLLVLLAGALISMAVERITAQSARKQSRQFWQGRKSAKPPLGKLVPVGSAGANAADFAADQLKAIMQARFTASPVLNKPERRLLECIDKALAELSPGWRAMAQVSLGEILRSESKEAFMAINSKRVDLLIVDAECRPLHAVEFQGTGHHLGPETAARDAVKREALRRAGISFVEVVSGDTPGEVRELVRKLVGRSEASSATKLPKTAAQSNN